MFKKETFRLIKKTYKRFISLTLIILIGVAFMIGLLSSSAIMRESMDKYNEEYVLHDVQIYSSYGFSDDDISALKNLKYVDKVFGSKFVDTYVKNADGRNEVYRVEEVQRNINKLKLASGRLPVNDDECVILVSSLRGIDYEINDYITVFLEDDNLEDKLAYTTFKIVGFVNSPNYSSKVLSASTLNNEELQNICYINKGNFKTDYYTSVYLTFKGAADIADYTASYDDFVAPLVTKLEEFALVQQEEFKYEWLNKAKKQIAEAEIEFETKKQEGLQELEDAYQKILDGQKQIDAGKKELQKNKNSLNSGQKQLDAALKELLKQEQQVNEAIETIESKYGSFEAAYSRLYVLYQAYQRAVNAKSTGTLLSIAKQFNLEVNYQNVLESVLKGLDKLANGSVIDSYNQILMLMDAPDEIAKGKATIASKQKQIDAGWEKITAAEKKLADSQKEIDDGLKAYQEGLETYNREIVDAEIKIRNAKAEIEDLPEASWYILDRNSCYSYVLYDANTAQMENLGIYVPLLFFLVAALVCSTTLKRLIDEQRGQNGIFFALGYEKNNIVHKYQTYAALASIIGSCLGVPIGIALFPSVIYNTWRLMYMEPKMLIVIPYIYLAICLSSFFILTQIITIIVVRSNLKELPASLMRPKANIKGKKILLERIKFIWNKLSFINKVTLRNLFRYKSRAFMTIIGIAGCTALLVFGWGIKDSINSIIEIQYQEIFKYDYTITLSEDNEYQKIIDCLKTDTNNEKIVPFSSYTSKIYFNEEENAINVQVLNKNDYTSIITLRDAFDYTALNLDDGVIISKKFAKNHDIKVGDIIVMESSTGYKKEAKVSAICEMYFQHYLFMSESYYQKIFGENVDYNVIGLDTSNGEINITEITQFETYQYCTDFASLVEEFETMIEVLTLIVLVIIITAGSLAFVVLYNLIQVNISERSREIATLKVLGFKDNEINSYIFKEIIILTLIGDIIGLPLGIVEHRFIMSVIDMEMITFGYNISPISFILSFTITFLFAIIVLLFTKKSLKKVEMVESLKSVE